MAIQRLDREDVAAFESDQFLADVIRGRVDIRDGSLHDEIDDGSLCIIAHAEDALLKFARFTADCILGSVESLNKTGSRSSPDGQG